MKNIFFSTYIFSIIAFEANSQILLMKNLERFDKMELSNHITTTNETFVKMQEFVKSDVINEVEGTKAENSFFRKVNISKRNNDLLLSRIISRLICKNGEHQLIYDSENPFERSESGDNMANHWDRYIKKNYKINYLANGSTDTLQQVSGISDHWQGYVPINFSKQNPEWDCIILLCAIGKPLQVGNTWEEKQQDNGLNIDDKYLVTKIEAEKITLAFIRVGEPVKKLTKEEISNLTTEGDYPLSSQINGTIIINKFGLIYSIEADVKKKKIRVEPTFRVEIEGVSKVKVDNQVK